MRIIIKALPCVVSREGRCVELAARRYIEPGLKWTAVGLSKPVFMSTQSGRVIFHYSPVLTNSRSRYFLCGKYSGVQDLPTRPEATLEGIFGEMNSSIYLN